MFINIMRYGSVSLPIVKILEIITYKYLPAQDQEKQVKTARKTGKMRKKNRQKERDYPINAERCVQHLLSERLRLSA